MRKLAAFLLIFVFTASASATTCGSFTIPGTCYYLANAGGGGSDANNGTSAGTPWLTPNHAVNCGDMLLAAAGTYVASNLQTFGTVTCAAANNVAWVACATFDGCKSTGSNTPAFIIRQSYWGVQGWEVAGTGNLGVCFYVSPSGATQVHHIVLINNVCKGGANGFSFSSGDSTHSFDYAEVLANIAWNAAQSTALCNSGITIYEPIKSDSAPGTHIYVAGNFLFDNVTPTNCSGGSATYDGEGAAFDDWGNSQSGGVAYNQQGVIENNLSVYNGGYGIGVTGSGTQSALIYFDHNTSVHNMLASPTNTTTCGDMTLIGPVSHVEQYYNLVQTAGATGCSGAVALYAMNANQADATDKAYNNFLYSAAGNNTSSVSSSGYVYGPGNVTGTDPAFSSVADPGSPSCGSASSTVNCMATVISNYTPATAAAKSYGYQTPSSTSVYNPLFPQWLCANVVNEIPTGLITPGCVQAGTITGNLK